ncbi:MAG: hypothetical protein BM564_11380 [Bacteroidetes bacterium MedPE-SWsnd-G2]|nr:MAG: hypothetical protein BM564_11380 [Bacteroidetes bacterium MedPE-SWsnd-G2]
MAEFLTTNGTSYHIEKIITGASKKLILVSPYLQLSKTFFERLQDASKRNVSIKIIYGKDELKPNEKSSLSELDNLELLFFKNLHAKCYFNEKEMVITSMNMYEFSEKNNREMGVYATRKQDKELFSNAVNETLSIIQSSEVIDLTYSSRDNYSLKRIITSNSNNHLGFCIRCKDRIDFNIDKPYCNDCYSVWLNFKNFEYIENACHNCGEYAISSMDKPECYSCFKL